jgi:hypothetical protein
VRRAILAVIVVVLSIGASGVSALVVSERCTPYERSASQDDACPPTCLTCGCCAQAVEPVALTVRIIPQAPVANIAASALSLEMSQARDILHVPKSRIA